jgi:hypothetical protein
MLRPIPSRESASLSAVVDSSAVGLLDLGPSVDDRARPRGGGHFSPPATQRHRCSTTTTTFRSEKAAAWRTPGAHLDGKWRNSLVRQRTRVRLISLLGPATGVSAVAGGAIVGVANYVINPVQAIEARKADLRRAPVDLGAVVSHSPISRRHPNQPERGVGHETSAVSAPDRGMSV